MIEEATKGPEHEAVRTSVVWPTDNCGEAEEENLRESRDEIPKTPPPNPTAPSVLAPGCPSPRHSPWLQNQDENQIR